MPNLTSQVVSAGGVIRASHHNTLVADVVSLNRGLENYVSQVTGTNAISLTTGYTITAYRTGMKFTFKAVNKSTAAVSLQVNNLGQRAVFNNGVRVGVNDIQVNGVYEVVFFDNRWNLVTSAGGGINYLGGGSRDTLIFSTQLVTSSSPFTPNKQFLILAIVSTAEHIIITRNNARMRLTHDYDESFAAIVIDANDTISIGSGYAILSLGE